MWSALCVGLLPIVAVTGQVALEQHPREVTVREGDPGTFQCSMKGDSMNSYYMYWYRQGPRGSLEWIYMEGDFYGEGFRDRFKGRLESSKNSFTLQILAAKPGDSAIYYCGTRRFVDWFLPFGVGIRRETGPGTTLTVLQKVIVEKSTKAEDLTTTGKTTPLPTTKNLETSTMEQNTSASTTEVMCTDKFDSNVVTILPDAEGHRVNMLSMAVLGLRVLLAKSIAFNTLMSIKLFLL